MLETLLIVLMIVALSIALISNIIVLISGLRKAKAQSKKKP